MLCDCLGCDELSGKRVLRAEAPVALVEVVLPALEGPYGYKVLLPHIDEIVLSCILSSVIALEELALGGLIVMLSNKRLCAARKSSVAILACLLWYLTSTVALSRNIDSRLCDDSVQHTTGETYISHGFDGLWQALIVLEALISVGVCFSYAAS
ncbi:hypothetical protein F0562_017546 [Nyssa sinensis]|uniref:Uncharacterized protein n=1 Tax=Nyssa sinensis TaxID=561372 RepID=A0A5J4ZI79_9ASTE|nr:hypothetical protein F0562_017546 [Nyssa sinensis]